MNDVVKAAMKEAEKLREQMAKTPAGKRLRLLEQVINEFGTNDEQQKPGLQIIITDPDEGYRPTLFTKTNPTKRRSNSAAVIEGAQNYLRRIQRRANSTEITGILLSEKIKIGGKKPVQTVASYLSESNLFDNVKGEGYGLTEWVKTP